jgi:hypothetical protein
MIDVSAEQAVSAILARDHLQVAADEYARLVRLYAELQIQLAALRTPEVRDREPAITFSATR